MSFNVIALGPKVFNNNTNLGKYLTITFSINKEIDITLFYEVNMKRI